MSNVVSMFDAKTADSAVDESRAERDFVNTYKEILLQPRGYFALAENTNGSMCLWSITGEKPEFYCEVGDNLALFLRYDFRMLRDNDQRGKHLKKTMYMIESSTLTTWERMAALSLAFHADEDGWVHNVTQKTLAMFYGSEVKNFNGAMWSLKNHGLISTLKHEETYTPNSYRCKWL